MNILEAAHRIARESAPVATERLSLAEFMRGAWHVVEPAVDLRWGWYLDCLCEHAEAVWRRDIQYLVVNMPPGAAKSIIWNVMLPTWGWTQEPGHRFLCVSNTNPLATRDSRRARDVILSEWFQERWPHVKLAHDQSEKVEFATVQQGIRRVMSTSSRVTGHRGDTVIIDDPQDARSIVSSIYRDDTNDMVCRILPSRVTQVSVRAAMVVVQQRLHVEDATAKLLEIGGWERLCLPLEKRASIQVPMALPTWEDPREEGEVLNPDMWTPDAIARLKRQLGRLYEAQANQQPSADVEGALLSHGVIESTRVHQRPALERIFVSIDPAVTAKADTSDETGIVCCGLAKSHGYVLEECGVIEASRAWARRAVIMHDRWDASAVVAETNNGGDLVEDAVKQAAEQLHREGRRGTPHIRVIQVKAGTGQSKYTRADPIAGLYEDGLIHHVGHHPKLESEWCSWVPGEPSPNVLDAAVWGFTELLLKSKQTPFEEQARMAQALTQIGEGLESRAF